MATALLGQIESYDSAQEEWPQYVERLEQFFVVNEITDEAKSEKTWATFLSVVGRSSYTLLQSLIANQQIRPSNNWLKSSWSITVHNLLKYLQCFRFTSHSRKEGESIADYVAELAEFCNYGETLDKMLRDRLVWGVRDASIRKKLLGNSS